LGATLLFLAGGIPAVAQGADKLPATVGIGTHPVGGAYHACGSAIAALISEKTKIRAVVQPFAGPNAWMPLMQSGELEMGLVSGFDAGASWMGKFGYDRPTTNFRLVLHGNVVSNSSFTVLKKSGYKKVIELKGKKIPSEFGGNFMFHQLMEAMLRSVGMTWKDVVAVPTPDFISSLRMLREGRIDAGPSGSPTTPAALELNTALGVNVLSYGDMQPSDLANGVPEKMQAILDDLLPGTFPKVVKAGLGVIEKDTVLISYPIYLTASSKLSDDAVYLILKTVYENTASLAPAHAWLKAWKPDAMAAARQPAPYHNGAIKFFKEKGVWTEAMEKRQGQLLKP